jgi:hypothetical protein
MSTKSSPKAKPRTKPARTKGGRSAGNGPAKSKAAKPEGTKPEARGARKGGGNSTGTKRLRPGELDGLVVAHMRERGEVLPLGAAAIAKGIERSSGAVGNCLERLAKGDTGPVRRVTDKPRAYDLGGGPDGKTQA